MTGSSSIRNSDSSFPASRGLADVFYKKLLKHKYRQEEISERLRVLYVALSRAKEQMIVVAPDFLEFRRFEELIPFVDRLNYKSFHAVFLR